MYLRKHYLDLVTPDDRVRIAYVAELRFGALELRYAAVLRSDGGEPPRTETTLTSATEPERKGDVVTWHAPALGIESTHTRTVPGPRVDILPAGGLVWDCHTLRADVIFRDRGETLRGSGYAETLETTIAPWNYPWQELHWGRLHDDEGSFVWTVLDGGEIPRAYFARGSELDESGTIPNLEELRILRSGRIGETVLSVVPVLSRLPGRILGLSETKRLSRSHAGGRAIHESVRWPLHA